MAGNTVVPPPGGAGTSTSGCAPADFAGMPAGAIALIHILQLPAAFDEPRRELYEADVKPRL